VKTLRCHWTHEFVCVQWQKCPAILISGSTHFTLGLYRYAVSI
jgi:hypothetical protein